MTLKLKFWDLSMITDLLLIQSNCWFAGDVMAAMDVGGQEQKHFSPLGTKLHF